MKNKLLPIAGAIAFTILGGAMGMALARYVDASKNTNWIQEIREYQQNEQKYSELNSNLVRVYTSQSRELLQSTRQSEELSNEYQNLCMETNILHHQLAVVNQIHNNIELDLITNLKQSSSQTANTIKQVEAAVNNRCSNVVSDLTPIK